MIIPGVQKPHCRPCVLPERLLHRVQLAALGEPLDRGDRAAVGLDGEHACTTSPRCPSRWIGAGAALARVAADLRAGQAEPVADEVDEQRPRLDVRLPRGRR